MIKQFLFKDASFTQTLSDIQIRVTKPSPRMVLIPSSQRIIELESTDFLQFAPGYNSTTISNVRGVHNTTDGRLYLHQGHWCIKTAIHETLHACSIPSLIDTPSYRPTYEGLTELYTGYIMHKAFPNSYQYCWRGGDERMCRNTYDDTIRIWGAFCHFIPLKETIPIYFYQGNNDLVSLHEAFAKRVSTTVKKEFANPFALGGLSTHTKLENECRKCFDKAKFNRIWSSREKYTDFNSMQI